MTEFHLTQMHTMLCLSSLIIIIDHECPCMIIGIVHRPLLRSAQSIISWWFAVPDLSSCQKRRKHMQMPLCL
ncbi:hypothetical protein NC652_040349 [Populus alba x Populus x berolinensis]|uniref:Uncharacterized protein n=1 Tax=Populus alba x Populus x berolinensis TaxID=444605 RepID=A0AAD6PSI1_9ROSI|nr:hypothetical protein NC652_040349 [Populus alba x Populus x berolinensis]KAJ6958704.1 hypothetical protein NC653_040375 [Populus alba x Populus x berolinensis]